MDKFEFEFHFVTHALHIITDSTIHVYTILFCERFHQHCLKETFFIYVFFARFWCNWIVHCSYIKNTEANNMIWCKIEDSIDLFKFIEIMWTVWQPSQQTGRDTGDLGPYRQTILISCQVKCKLSKKKHQIYYFLYSRIFLSHIISISFCRLVISQLLLSYQGNIYFLEIF